MCYYSQAVAGEGLRKHIPSGRAKKLQKSFKNRLTISKRCDIIGRLSRKESDPTWHRKICKRERKKLKKSFKKRLTSKSGCVIMDKLFTREHRTKFGSTQIKNWIEGNELNIFLWKLFESFCQLTFSTQVLKVSQQNNVRAVARKSSFKQLNLRVWFWLRMNAGGVLNTCKSNGQKELAPFVSGGRVSNTWATCPYLGNNTVKIVLIPHKTTTRHLVAVKDLSDMDGLASH